MSVRLKVWGDFACFTRPEMKAERVSYDVITPSAARGLIEAIYWKPDVRWEITAIQVLRPIRFLNFRRNEVGEKVSTAKIKSAMKGKPLPFMTIEDQRQLRASMLLRDVAYIVEARFHLCGPKAGPAAKVLEIFKRRAARGQCFYQPFLGCREFPAFFQMVDRLETPHDSLMGSHDLGYMLHDMVFTQGTYQAHFFRAHMKDGLIRVPPWPAGKVAS